MPSSTKSARAVNRSEPTRQSRGQLAYSTGAHEAITSAGQAAAFAKWLKHPSNASVQSCPTAAVGQTGGRGLAPHSRECMLLAAHIDSAVSELPRWSSKNEQSNAIVYNCPMEGHAPCIACKHWQCMVASDG